MTKPCSTQAGLTGHPPLFKYVDLPPARFKASAPPAGQAAPLSVPPPAPRVPRLSLVWLALLTGILALFLSPVSARAQGTPPGCTGSGLGITLYTDSPDVHIGDTLHYSITVFNGTGVGPSVCDATNILAFIVTPDGVTNMVTLVRTTLVNGQANYYQNVVAYVVRAQDLRPDGSVRATAYDTGAILQNDTPSEGGGNQGVNTQVTLPSLLLVAACQGGVGENGLITFTGTVTNNGNVNLTNVTITNFVNGTQAPVAFFPSLRTNQVVSFSGSYVPANPCLPGTAQLVATGVEQFTANPRSVTGSATVTCAETLTPGIVVTKACPAAPVAPGQLLAFIGSVKNSGNVTLTNIVVLDSQPVPNTVAFLLATLAPGATAFFTNTYVAPTNCTVTDTLTATAASVCGVPVTNSASVTCPIVTTPQIAVTAVCAPGPILPGGAATYNGTVRNTGNNFLVNVSVVSDRPTPNTIVFTVASLAPGATANFTGTYTVPAGVCAVTTTFAGSGQDGCTLTAVTNTAAAACTVATAPALAVTLACPVVPAVPGGALSFTGTVRNTGNVLLNNVFVVNNQPAANTAVLGPLTLAPGATANFTATYAAPLDACSATSTVLATGNDGCTALAVSNAASATCTLTTSPGLLVTQVCPTNAPLPGGLLTYTGTVKNTGNISLANVVVVNNLSGATPVFTAATLAPGATAAFTGSYVAPTNCLSTSTATSTCGAGVTNAVTTTCGMLTVPQLLVTALCPPAPVVPGGSVVYNGTVRNTGNITLTNVLVTANQPAPNTPVFTVALLAPGATAAFTSTTPVPANACAVTTAFTGTA